VKVTLVIARSVSDEAIHSFLAAGELLKLAGPYFLSDFSMSARFSSWLASAVQLRAMLFSTVDRRAEFSGSAASILYCAA
jgi:hypothetical protein